MSKTLALHKAKRPLAMLLAILMVIMLLPVTALAAGTAPVATISTDGTNPGGAKILGTTGGAMILPTENATGYIYEISVASEKTNDDTETLHLHIGGVDDDTPKYEWTIIGSDGSVTISGAADAATVVLTITPSKLATIHGPQQLQLVISDSTSYSGTYTFRVQKTAMVRFFGEALGSNALSTTDWNTDSGMDWASKDFGAGGAQSGYLYAVNINTDNSFAFALKPDNEKYAKAWFGNPQTGGTPITLTKGTGDWLYHSIAGNAAVSKVYEVYYEFAPVESAPVVTAKSDSVTVGTVALTSDSKPKVTVPLSGDGLKVGDPMISGDVTNFKADMQAPGSETQITGDKDLFDTAAKVQVVDSTTHNGKFTGLGLDLTEAAAVAGVTLPEYVWIKQTNPLLSMYNKDASGDSDWITGGGTDWVKSKGPYSSLAGTFHMLVPATGTVKLEVFSCESNASSEPAEANLLFTVEVTPTLTIADAHDINSFKTAVEAHARADAESSINAYGIPTGRDGALFYSSGNKTTIFCVGETIPSGDSLEIGDVEGTKGTNATTQFTEYTYPVSGGTYTVAFQPVALFNVDFVDVTGTLNIKYHDQYDGSGKDKTDPFTDDGYCITTTGGNVTFTWDDGDAGTEEVEIAVTPGTYSAGVLSGATSREYTVTVSEKSTGGDPEYTSIANGIGVQAYYHLPESMPTVNATLNNGTISLTFPSAMPENSLGAVAINLGPNILSDDLATTAFKLSYTDSSQVTPSDVPVTYSNQNGAAGSWGAIGQNQTFSGDAGYACILPAGYTVGENIDIGGWLVVFFNKNDSDTTLYFDGHDNTKKKVVVDFSAEVYDDGTAALNTIKALDLTLSGENVTLADAYPYDKAVEGGTRTHVYYYGSGTPAISNLPQGWAQVGENDIGTANIIKQTYKYLQTDKIYDVWLWKVAQFNVTFSADVLAGTTFKVSYNDGSAKVDTHTADGTAKTSKSITTLGTVSFALSDTTNCVYTVSDSFTSGAQATSQLYTVTVSVPGEDPGDEPADLVLAEVNGVETENIMVEGEYGEGNPWVWAPHTLYKYITNKTQNDLPGAIGELAEARDIPVYEYYIAGALEDIELTFSHDITGVTKYVGQVAEPQNTFTEGTPVVPFADKVLTLATANNRDAFVIETANGYVIVRLVQIAYTQPVVVSSDATGDDAVTFTYKGVAADSQNVSWDGITAKGRDIGATLTIAVTLDENRKAIIKNGSEVLATLEESGAKHVINLAVGIYSFTVTFSDVDAPIQSSDATLKSLTTTSDPLYPAFNANTISYTIDVLNAVNAFAVTPTTNHDGATITLNGTPLTSGSQSGFTNLNVGENTFTIVVTAEDGSTKKTYTIVVTRAAKPVITISAQPTAELNLTEGDITGDVSVTASVTGGGTLSYQWYKAPTVSEFSSGVTIVAGATTDTLTIPTNLTAGAHYFFCRVSSEGAETVATNMVTVNVVKAIVELTWTQLIRADGASGTETTTTLILAFNKPIDGLDLEDIAVEIKGSFEAHELNQVGPSTYELVLVETEEDATWDDGDEATVTIISNPEGYMIEDVSTVNKSVTLWKAVKQITWLATEPEYKPVEQQEPATLTVTFSDDVSLSKYDSGEMEAGEVIVGGATLDSVTQDPDAKTWVLAISKITSETLTVIIKDPTEGKLVDLDGNAIAGMDVEVYKGDTEVSWSVEGDAKSDAATTTKITLTVDDVAGLSLKASDLTLSDGVILNSLIQKNKTTYELMIGGFTESKQITVQLEPIEGFTWGSGNTKQVQLYVKTVGMTFKVELANEAGTSQVVEPNEDVTFKITLTDVGETLKSSLITLDLGLTGLTPKSISTESMPNGWSVFGDNYATDPVLGLTIPLAPGNAATPNITASNKDLVIYATFTVGALTPGTDKIELDIAVIYYDADTDDDDCVGYCNPLVLMVETAELTVDSTVTAAKLQTDTANLMGKEPDAKFLYVNKMQTYNQVLALFTNPNSSLKIVLAEKSKAYVGTGSVVQLLSSDGAVIESVTVIVKGDTNGKGYTDLNDYTRVGRAFLNLYTLDGAFQIAGRTKNYSTPVTLNDYTRVGRAFLGLYDLYSDLVPIVIP